MTMNKIMIYTMVCIGLAISTNSSAQQTIKLSLKECREMALAHSEDLQQAVNRMKQAELDRQVAVTAYLPKIDGSVMGEYMFPDMDMMGVELRMRGTYIAGLTLTQPIYTGGKINSGRKLAKIGESVSSERQRAARMDALVEADNAYWTYIGVESKVRMLESYMAQMDTLKMQTTTAVEAGFATDNELLRVDAKSTEIYYQLQKAKNGAELCRMSLCRVVGVDYDTRIEPTDEPEIEIEPGNLATDISGRPEMRLLDMQVAAEQQKVKMTRSDMLPTIGFSLGYTYYGNIKTRTMVDVGDGVTIPYTSEFKDGIGLAMLSVQVPIFHWGESFKKLSKARYSLTNSRLQRQKNVSLMDIEVRRAVMNIGDGYRMIETAERGLSRAEENLRVMGDRYAAALSPLTDLLDAQSQWQQAESNLIEARTQYKIYETEYRRANGSL